MLGFFGNAFILTLSLKQNESHKAAKVLIREIGVLLSANRKPIF